MITLDTITEKLDFLKKYKLIPKTKKSLPEFYYYAPGSDIPTICEIIGYDEAFDDWAVIVIKANDSTIKIHSTYLQEMKDRGTAYYKKMHSEKTNNSYIFFDIETTGYSPKFHEIIEIAAVKYIDGNTVEFHEYVKIDSTIPTKITQLTDISNKTIQDADYIDLVMPRFLSFIEDSTLIGHNIKSFDIPFLNTFCTNLGLPQIKNNLIDTLPLSREKLPELDNHKLSTICDFYGIDTTNAHHALADSYLCDSVYKFLISDDVEIVAAASPFQQKMLTILAKIISEKELPDKSLRLRENKNMNLDSYSVLIVEPPYPLGSESKGGSQSTMKISASKNGYTIDIHKNVFDNVQNPDNISYKVINEKTEEKKKKNTVPTHVIISFPTDNSEFYNYVESIILYKLAHYRTKNSTFSCCSRFHQCSNEKKCVHENKLYSTACTYRKNLDNGRIFYGQNRNVD